VAVKHKTMSHRQLLR